MQKSLPQVLLFGGKGGVGKTTCAVASALTLAESHPDYRFLLVSTDPAHSLNDSIAGSHLPENLTSLEFDAKQAFDTFLREHQGFLKTIASRGTFLDDEDIDRFLSLSLPGLDELMGFLEIGRQIDEARYQTVILDTAPTGHTLRLLAMPQLIHPWLAALDALLGKHRYMKKLFSGSYEQDNVDHFLLDFSKAVEELHHLLQDSSRSLFVPVTIPESMALSETVRLVQELDRSDIPVTDILINRIHPQDSCQSCQYCQYESARQATTIQEMSQSLGLNRGYNFWGLPLSPTEIIGKTSLLGHWQCLQPLILSQSTTTSLQLVSPAPIPPLSLPHQKLIIIAGKGGVGKTTLAAATACEIGSCKERVLLFSTDPAHSLSDVFQTVIGPSPCKLSENLYAAEVDGALELTRLKSLYQQDLEEMFDSENSSLDFAFDREVLDRILDLSPPGLDEVMGVLKGIEFLLSPDYDRLVLDGAPTGHFLRLMETPELIDSWLKLFFDLFLKYSSIFRPNRMTAEMVAMSKALKKLRTMLQDSEQSCIFAVTIASRMAISETRDLIARCADQNISVQQVICNMLTPANDCGFCSKQNRFELSLLETLQDRDPIRVYRQREPTDLDALRTLGHRLYQGGRQ